MPREDDFTTRRLPLASLSDEELKERFWHLAAELVSPLVELARTHTTPSIERSVLLRMGFSSLEAQAITARCVERGLLGKGAGAVVWRYARAKGLPYLEAGRMLAAGKGWDEAEEVAGRDALARDKA
ncbi:MAG: ornithine aminomutase subunit alpha [Patescibacteria group bacterium]